MKFGSLFFILLCSAASAQKPAPAAPPPPPPGGILEAVSLLPKESAKRLARVEAREGRPRPERWYLLVHEPDAPNGLREFVVADGKIAAARHLSQFADRLTEQDEFGDAWLRVDSGYCARVAEAYAAANGARLAWLHYELSRPPIPTTGEPPKGEATWPVWHLTVLDQKGDQVGILTISAARGTVTEHEGFEKVPDSSLLPLPPTPPPASLTNPKPPPKDPKAKDAKGKATPTPKPTERKKPR